MTSRKVQDLLGQMQKTLECSICLEMMTNPVSTNCGHQFCRFCLTEFLERKKQVPCPLCKKPITKRSLTKRTQLGAMVDSVRNLITAFQTDTGALFSPPRGPSMNMLPSTPDVVQAKLSTSHSASLSVKRRSNVRRSIRKQDSPAIDHCPLEGDTIEDVKNLERLGNTAISNPHLSHQEKHANNKQSRRTREQTCQSGRKSNKAQLNKDEDNRNTEKLLPLIQVGGNCSGKIKPCSTKDFLDNDKDYSVTEKGEHLKNDQTKGKINRAVRNVDKSEALNRQLADMIENGSHGGVDSNSETRHSDSESRVNADEKGVEDVLKVRKNVIRDSSGSGTRESKTRPRTERLESGTHGEMISDKCNEVKLKTDLKGKETIDDAKFDFCVINESEAPNGNSVCRLSEISDAQSSGSGHHSLFRTPLEVNRENTHKRNASKQNAEPKRSLRSRDSQKDKASNDINETKHDENDGVTLTPDIEGNEEFSFLCENQPHHTYSRKNKEVYGKDTGMNKRVVAWLKTIPQKADKKQVVVDNKPENVKGKKLNRRNLKILHEEELMGQKMKTLAKHVHGDNLESLFGFEDFESSQKEEQKSDAEESVIIVEDHETSANIDECATDCLENKNSIHNGKTNLFKTCAIEGQSDKSKVWKDDINITVNAGVELTNPTYKVTDESEEVNSIPVQRKRIFKTRKQCPVYNVIETDKSMNECTVEDENVQDKKRKLENIIEIKSDENDTDLPSSDPYEFKSSGLTPRKLSGKGKQKKKEKQNAKQTMAKTKCLDSFDKNETAMKPSRRYETSDDISETYQDNKHVKGKNAKNNNCKNITIQNKLDKINADLNQAEDYDLLTCTQEAVESIVIEQKRRGTKTDKLDNSSILEKKVRFREPDISEFISPGKIDLIAYRKAKMKNQTSEKKAEDKTAVRLNLDDIKVKKSAKKSKVTDSQPNENETSESEDEDPASDDWRFPDDSSGTDDLHIEPGQDQTELPNLDIQSEEIKSQLPPELLERIAASTPPTENNNSSQIIEETPALFAVPKFNKKLTTLPRHKSDHADLRTNPERPPKIGSFLKTLKTRKELEVETVPETPVINLCFVTNIPETPNVPFELGENSLQETNDEHYTENPIRDSSQTNIEQTERSLIDKIGKLIKDAERVISKESMDTDETQSPAVEKYEGLNENIDVSRSNENIDWFPNVKTEFENTAEENEGLVHESSTQNSESILMPKTSPAQKIGKGYLRSDGQNRVTSVKDFVELSSSSDSDSVKLRKGKRKCFMLEDSPPESLDFGSLPAKELVNDDQNNKPKRTRLNRLKRSPKSQALVRALETKTALGKTNSPDVIPDTAEELKHSAEYLNKDHEGYKVQKQQNKKLTHKEEDIQSKVVIIPDSVRSDMTTLEPESLDMERYSETENIHGITERSHASSQASVGTVDSVSQRSLHNFELSNSKDENQPLFKESDKILMLHEESYNSTQENVEIPDSPPVLVDSSTFSVNIIPETEMVEDQSEMPQLDIKEDMETQEENNDGYVRKTTDSNEFDSESSKLSRRGTFSSSRKRNINEENKDIEMETRHLSKLKTSRSVKSSRQSTQKTSNNSSQGSASTTSQKLLLDNEIADYAAKKRHLSGMLISPEDTLNRSANLGSPEDIFLLASEMPAIDSSPDGDSLKPVYLSDDEELNIEQEGVAIFNNDTDESKGESNNEIDEEMQDDDIDDTNDTNKKYTLARKNIDRKVSSFAEDSKEINKSSQERTPNKSPNGRTVAVSEHANTPESNNKRRSLVKGVRGFSKRKRSYEEVSDSSAGMSSDQSALPKTPTTFNSQKYKSPVAKFISPRLLNAKPSPSTKSPISKYGSPAQNRLKAATGEQTPLKPILISSKAVNVLKYSPALRKKQNVKESPHIQSEVSKPEVVDLQTHDVDGDIDDESAIVLPDLENKELSVQGKLTETVITNSGKKKTSIVSPRLILKSPDKGEPLVYSVDVQQESAETDRSETANSRSEKGLSCTTVPDSMPENSVLRICSQNSEAEIEEEGILSLKEEPYTNNDENRLNCSSTSSEFRLDSSVEANEEDKKAERQAIDVISKFNQIVEDSEMLNDCEVSEEAHDFIKKNKDNVSKKSNSQKEGDETNNSVYNITEDLENRYSTNLDSSPAGAELGSQQVILESDVEGSEVEGHKESDDEESEENVVRRKNVKKAVIADSSSDEEDDSSRHMNMTSSSAFSSQSECLTTQEKVTLEKDLERMAHEMKTLKEQLRKSKGQDGGHHVKKRKARNESSSLTLVIVDDSDDAMIEADDSEIEAENDLSQPPLSPSRSQEPMSPPLSPSRSQEPMSPPLSPSGSQELVSIPPSPSRSQEPDENVGILGNSEDNAEVTLENLPYSAYEPQPTRTSLTEIDGEPQPSTRTAMTESDAEPQLATRTALADIDGNIRPVPAPAGQKKTLGFVATGLTVSQVQTTKKLAALNDVKFYTKFNDAVTHVIVKPADDDDVLCDRTLKFFQGIAHKCWVVNYFWVTDSRQVGYLLPEGPYEIQGDTANGETHQGPKRSRLSNNKLFSDMVFSLFGDNTYLSKDSMTELVQTCGGQVVDLCQLGQGHARSLIITCTDIEEEGSEAHKKTVTLSRELYNKYEIVTLTREWVLDSLTLYRLQPLHDYIITDVKNAKIPNIV